METGKNLNGRKLEPWLGGLALLVLLIGCFLVMRPFLSALMWAIVLAFSLNPLQRRFTRWFRGARTLAACLVTLTLTLVLVGPVVLIGYSLAEDGKALVASTRQWVITAPDVAPGWMTGIPVVGDELGGYWSDFAADRNRWVEQFDKAAQRDHAAPPPPVMPSEEEAAAEASRSARLLGRGLVWAQKGLVAAGLAVGQGVTQVLLSAFLTFFLLRDSDILARRLGVTVERLSGGRGKHLLKVAGDTVRGVVYGILGTALVQAVVAGVGFSIAGVPGAVLLAVLTFFVAVVPFGPPLVWIPAALWLFTQGSPGWGVFILLWGGLGISSVDNILRPYLISQGSKMPFALIFCGVIGGAFAFGLVGVFLGPTLLAVAFRLIEEWSEGPMKPPPSLGEVDPVTSADG